MNPLPRSEAASSTKNRRVLSSNERQKEVHQVRSSTSIQSSDAGSAVEGANDNQHSQRLIYRCNRLPYGVASSPAIFQEIMDKILHGLHHVVWYVDDILVTRATDEEHLSNLDKVLRHLEKHGLRARMSKCQDSVEYLGTCDRQRRHTSGGEEGGSHRVCKSTREHRTTSIVSWNGQLLREVHS